jgi:hypothetical protein
MKATFNPDINGQKVNEKNNRTERNAIRVVLSPIL